MSQQLEKLKTLLAELFQLDQAELDFGIYRIMNTKRGEITRFLDNDLLPQVREVLGRYEKETRTALAADLEKAKEQAKALGFDDPLQAPRVKELQVRYNTAFDLEAAESEVYSHLYNFFRRYYSEGDFISQRRYKEGVYAIPYEGEEVKLYWANHDQYYIKTSEYLRDYTFKLPSGKRVHFKLAQADTEKDNNRAPNGNERRFVLGRGDGATGRHGDGETWGQGDIWVIENDELVIFFRFLPDPERRRQADLNTEAAQRIADIVAKSPALQIAWSDLLERRPTEKNPNRTLLEKHLTDYTARNTFDYFIHKDLGGFLRRELDFYIKNEVMHLDDVESETAPRVEQYLSKIKAIRRIAHKLIDFLAQIENFQKKLWLKKKFVVETQYCITLDRIFAIEDEKTRDWLLDQIIKNDAQREEWVQLLAIDEIEKDLTKPGYSKPLSGSFLKANPFLVVDTKHFDDQFKGRLLASLHDLHSQLDGLLIQGDNFHAVELLQGLYRRNVQCLYLDPPFNTSEETFTYKNSYKHSSWLSMMCSRAESSLALLSTSGVVLVAIDDEEAFNLKQMLDSVFGAQNFLGTVVVQNNPRGRTINAFFATSHEYYLVYARNAAEASIANLALTPEQAAEFKYKDEISEYRLLPFRRSGGLSTPQERPNSEYPIYYDPQSKRIDVEAFPGAVKIMPIDSSGARRVWRQTRPSLMAAVQRGDIVITQSGEQFTVYMKDRIKEGRKPKTIWADAKYDASSHGTILLKHILGERRLFSYPKSLYSTLDALRCGVGGAEEAIVLDFFGGSGTTGHAVIELNKEDDGRRKYVLVEMGEYFDTVLVPRIKKIVYSKDWKDGEPVSREGTSQMFKYIRLESYEDTLNNLELKRTGPQQMLLEQQPAFREDYMLRYMLDVESRGSASLLNIDRFEDPFNYTLDIATGTAGETKATVVDLVETFNYLIGLRVKTMDDVRGVRVVTGLSPQGERVLILWRKTKELDNDALDAWFRKQGYNSRDQEYDVIYVNGDNNLENLRKADQTWKVRLIEEEFRRLMFDVQDV